MKLYTFFRNSAGYRVRIALHLKDIAFDYVSVDIRVGRQHDETFRAINPQGLIPALEHDGKIITQSQAIIEYLEELKPTPSLLPEDRFLRAKSRAFASAIAAEIHSLNNTRVHGFLGDELGVDAAGRGKWYAHWGHLGLAALETELMRAGPHTFAFADYPTIADIFLIPQVSNFARFGFDFSPYPNILRVVDACNALPAFQKAMPEMQPDYVEGE